MPPAKVDLTYRETTSNRKLKFGEVEGNFKGDDLSILVLKYSPLDGVDVGQSIPYRIDSDPKGEVRPTIGRFNGRESGTHELNIGNLSRVAVVFYCNNQEAGTLEIAANQE